MIRVISVKFRDGGKSYFFDPGELEIKEGDGVIVETARGIEFADVVSPVQEIDEGRVVAPLKGVIRGLRQGAARYQPRQGKGCL